MCDTLISTCVECRFKLRRRLVLGVSMLVCFLFSNPRYLITGRDSKNNSLSNINQTHTITLMPDYKHVAVARRTLASEHSHFDTFDTSRMCRLTWTCPLLQTQHLDCFERGNSALHFHTSQCECTFVHIYTQNIKHASRNAPLELCWLRNN